MHEKIFTLFRQTLRDGKLTFEAQNGDQVGNLTADGFKPCSDIKIPSARQQSTSTRIDQSLLEILQIKKANSGIFDRVGEPIQLLVILEYVLLSYCYRRFDTLPALWLYAPNQIVRVSLFAILAQICFNGYRVYPYDRAPKIQQRVEESTSTLIFEDVGGYSKWVRGYWLDYPIERARALERWAEPLYSPVIVISKDLPPENYHLHTLEITHPSLVFSDLSTVDNLQTLQTMFVTLAFKIDEAIIDDGPSPELLHPYEMQLQTLRAVNGALRKCGYLSTGTEEDVNTFLDEQAKLALRRSQSFQELVIEAVADFLAQKQIRHQMRRNENFVALQNIVEDLHRHTQVRPNFNEWYLSRLLRGERIIIGKSRLQRIRVKKRVNGKDREVIKQVTFVRIDESRLTELIRSVS